MPLQKGYRHAFHTSCFYGFPTLSYNAFSPIASGDCKLLESSLKLRRGVCRHRSRALCRRICIIQLTRHLPHRILEEKQPIPNIHDASARRIYSASTMPRLDIYFDDNLKILKSLPSSSINLIYIDPPFNTGKVQKRIQLKTVCSADGDRTGFGNKRYKSESISSTAYNDKFDDFMGFIEPRLKEAKRLLTANGSLFFHLDYREIHYCKILLDEIFGREAFINEIIWSYDYGARSRKRWSTKHDNILWYTNDPDNYIFNYDEIDRIPYMAPSLVGEEKARIGKTPTDVWWNTIVSPNGTEKTGYSTQKPLSILNRIVRVHSCIGDNLCDFFAGSGSFGEAAYRLGRNCILVDNNCQAIEVMKKRFEAFNCAWHETSNNSL